MTTTQEDHVTDIMFNTPIEEIPAVIAGLSLEEQVFLFDQCRAIAERLERIVEQLHD